jgi:hypothetical protein
MKRAEETVFVELHTQKRGLENILFFTDSGDEKAHLWLPSRKKKAHAATEQTTAAFKAVTFRSQSQLGLSNAEKSTWEGSAGSNVQPGTKGFSIRMRWYLFGPLLGCDWSNTETYGASALDFRRGAGEGGCEKDDRNAESG